MQKNLTCVRNKLGVLENRDWEYEICIKQVNGQSN
jgi:hypothetical protein